MTRPRTFKIVELGCPKSEVDASWLAASLEDGGLERVWDDDEPADVTIVNTCAFLSETKKASIDALASLAARGDTMVVAFGCLVEVYPREAERFSDVALGLADVTRALEAIDAVAAGRPFARSRRKGALPGELLCRSLPARNYQYVKVAEGCSNFCRYCRIPQIRGRFKSRPMDHIVREVEALFEASTDEVVLVAQDLTRWGEDIYGRPRLDALLEELVRIARDRWIRLLYLHPARLTKRLVELVASHPQICSYLDIPIQHISDGVLARMGRPHGVKNPRFMIEWIRENYPDIALRTTVIVGYPYETERDFRSLYDFCRTVEFDHLGVFAFSPEPRTPAARVKQAVPDEVRQRRLVAMEQLAQRTAERRNRRLVGRVMTMLLNPDVESTGEAAYRTEYQAPEIDGVVWVETNRRGRPRNRITAEVLGAVGFDCFAVEVSRR